MAEVGTLRGEVVVLLVEPLRQQVSDLSVDPVWMDAHVDRLVLEEPSQDLLLRLLPVLHLHLLLQERQRLVEHGAERDVVERSEEHTSELQSLMRISYAVFCL